MTEDDDALLVRKIDPIISPSPSVVQVRSLFFSSFSPFFKYDVYTFCFGNFRSNGGAHSTNLAEFKGDEIDEIGSTWTE